MPTGQSFWIDETCTLNWAQTPGFASLLQRIGTERDSLTQMPLGIIAFWLWEKIAPASEWGFRSINILWVCLAALAMFFTGRRLRLPALSLWLVLQPFLWSYANEARPYAMQIAGSAWLMHGLTACVQDKGRGTTWAWTLMAGAVVMTGATMLGALFLILPILILCASFKSWHTHPPRATWLPIGIGGLLLAILAVHYAATVLRGAGGARVWEVGLANAVFAGYELLGFLGLGPSRLEIREAARQSSTAIIPLLKSTAPLLGLMGALYLLLLLPLKKGPDRARQPMIAHAFSMIVVFALLLMTAAIGVGWPFWGRHLAPILPFSTLLVAWLADRFFREIRMKFVAFIVPALLAILLLASSLNLRFSTRHQKDDYRRAVSVACLARDQGSLVWWSADRLTAEHYKLPFEIVNERGGAIRYISPFPPDTNPPEPSLVITSKPDLFDRDSRLKQWLNDNHYRKAKMFPGFTVWTPPSPDPTP